jgi:hypothetical protein
MPKVTLLMTSLLRKYSKLYFSLNLAIKQASMEMLNYYVPNSQLIAAQCWWFTPTILITWEA